MRIGFLLHFYVYLDTVQYSISLLRGVVATHVRCGDQL